MYNSPDIRQKRGEGAPYLETGKICWPFYLKCFGGETHTQRKFCRRFNREVSVAQTPGAEMNYEGNGVMKKCYTSHKLSFRNSRRTMDRKSRKSRTLTTSRRLKLG